MSNIFPIGERLREERERLGYKQEQFAALAGLTRKTLFGYESGTRAPDASALSIWSEIGLDVLYVVTGQRIPALVLPAAPLDPDEIGLLDNYRNSSKEAQAALKSTSNALASRKVKKIS